MEEKLYKLLIRRFNKRSFDACDFTFFCPKEVRRNDSYFNIGSRVFVVAKEQIENCGFWVHEFSELTIIGILERWWHVQWRTIINWNKYGLKKTTLPHIISPYGVDNGRTLFPQKDKKIPEW